MDFENVKKVVLLMADLSAPLKNIQSPAVTKKIENRIGELAAAIEFKEKDLECFLNGSTGSLGEMLNKLERG